MLSQVIIFGPSVARYRVYWLTGKLGSAHLAVLALAATPGGMVSEMLRDQLLDHVDAAAISERRGASRAVLSQEIPLTVADTIDLMEMGWTKLLGDAFATLQRQEDWAPRVIGRSQKDANVIIKDIVRERLLHDAMVTLPGGFSTFFADLVDYSGIGLFFAAMVDGPADATFNR